MTWIKRAVSLCIFCLLLGLSGCAAEAGETPAALEMRPFPYPYRAMLALCSDIDNTTPQQFLYAHSFLNTREETPMGGGLGLDVGNSFWMFMASDSGDIVDRHGNGMDAVMTWFHGTSDIEKDAGMIAYYFQKGWIDSIHSWGDFSRQDEGEFLFTREMAERAAAALAARDIRPTVWINHGNAANSQNMEARDRKTYRQGARPGSDAYHADLTVPLGIRFVWFSDNDRRFGRQDILYPVTLADGQNVWGFRRYTPGWSVYSLHEQLSDENLDAIVRDGLPVVVAQHFGGTNYWFPFLSTTTQALRNLAERQERGEILVARTSRMLEFLRVRDHLVYEYTEGVVNILAIDDPQLGVDGNPALDSLRGMTFYVDDMARAELRVNGRPTPEHLLVRARDETGRDTIGVAWFEAGE
jgi:hypothetical protein